MVLIYIWFRFEWQFAMGAVASLLHDVIITIGVLAILRIEFNLNIIAAILTIIGYSLNDTVVIYDRIREYLRKFKKKPFVDLIDEALNSNSRAPSSPDIDADRALALYVWGGEVIRGFTFTMIFGVLIGTYSSLFVAAPVMILLGSCGRPARRARRQGPDRQPPSIPRRRHRGLWQRGLSICRHVAQRLAAHYVERHSRLAPAAVTDITPDDLAHPRRESPIRLPSDRDRPGHGSCRSLPCNSQGGPRGLEVMDTGAGVRTYNILLAEDRPPAAALIAVMSIRRARCLLP